MTGAKPASSQNNNRSLRRKTAARMAAIEHLYASHFSPSGSQTAEAQADAIMEEQKARKEAEDKEAFLGEVPERALLVVLLESVRAHETSIRDLIKTSLGEKWSAERLGPLLEAILLTAVGELMARKDRSPGVIIHEYVSLAELYFEDDDIVGFVNAILATIAKKLR